MSIRFGAGGGSGSGGASQASLDTEITNRTAADTTLQGLITTNGVRVNGTFRVFEFDGADWVAVDGQPFDLDDRAGQSDAGRPYFFEGPSAEIDLLDPEDFDLAVRTD